MSPKQKKIASKAPPPDKITGADFAVLKKEKAKGRGMGLQDEEIKPGKVMKAKTGKQIVKEFSASLKGIDESFKSKTHPMKKQRLMDRSTVVKARVGKSIDKKAYMKTIGVYPKVSGAPKNLNKAFMKTVGVLPTINKLPPAVKGNQLGGGKLKALGRVMGSRAALLGALGATAVAGLNMAGKKLKEFADKKKDKKMVGGMAKKYSVGGGADTGRAGERRSKMYVLLDKMKRRRTEDRVTERDLNMPSRMSRPAYVLSEAMKERDRLTNRDIEEATKALKPSQRKSLRQSATPGYLPKPAIGKMGGGMMNKPMGYKSGTMVKARGCKLGRTRPTKMY